MNKSYLMLSGAIILMIVLYIIRYSSDTASKTTLNDIRYPSTGEFDMRADKRSFISHIDLMKTNTEWIIEKIHFGKYIDNPIVTLNIISHCSSFEPRSNQIWLRSRTNEKNKYESWQSKITHYDGSDEKITIGLVDVTNDYFVVGILPEDNNPRYHYTIRWTILQ